MSVLCRSEDPEGGEGIWHLVSVLSLQFSIRSARFLGKSEEAERGQECDPREGLLLESGSKGKQAPS